MKILLIVLGSVRSPLAEAVREYEERAGRYWSLQVVELPAGAPGRKSDPDRVREMEAGRIRERIPEGGDLWILTREGKGLSSEGWARALGRRALHGGRPLTLLVGGAFGFDEELLSRADRRISLGPATLPHELARLVLVEQLYRAGTILRNEPYHKGGRR